MMYINSRSAANNLDENCPPPKSMARLMTRSLAASQVTSLILRNENVDGDDGGKRNESPRPLHPVRPAEDESTAGPSSSASPPGRPKALKTLPSHAASPDYELTRKSIKALRMQIIAMHSQLKSELEEVKYMVRKAVLQTSNAT